MDDNESKKKKKEKKWYLLRYTIENFSTLRVDFKVHVGGIRLHQLKHVIIGDGCLRMGTHIVCPRAITGDKRGAKEDPHE
jgi:hypothetical protein